MTLGLPSTNSALREVSLHGPSRFEAGDTQKLSAIRGVMDTQKINRADLNKAIVSNSPPKTERLPEGFLQKLRSKINSNVN